MFEHFDKIRGNIFAIRIAGEISDKERKDLERLATEKIERHGRIRVLISMKHYASFNSAESLYEDLGFLARISESVEKMAVVGDRAWKATWVALFGLFGGIEAKYFGEPDFEEAFKWLTSLDS